MLEKYTSASEGFWFSALWRQGLIRGFNQESGQPGGQIRVGFDPHADPV